MLTILIFVAFFSFFILFCCVWIANGYTGLGKENTLPVYKFSSMALLVLKCFLSVNQKFNVSIRIFQFKHAINLMFNKERIVAIPAIGGGAVILLYKLEYLQAIMNSNTIISKSWMYKNLRHWLGDGLLLSSGDKWLSRRKLLTPAFHFSILENFIPIINSQAYVLIRKLKPRKNDMFVNIVPLISLCTLDIIGETAMGIKLNSQENAESEYIKGIQRLEKLTVSRVIYPWLWPDLMFYLSPTGRACRRAVATVHNFTRKIISERKNELEQEVTQPQQQTEIENIYFQKKERKALLDLLLHRHLETGDITEEDIREEVDTFMFAGHDTIAMGISWTIYNIGYYADVQTKVYEELLSIFEDDKERNVTSEDLREMKYLECVIKESMRLYPPVPFISRAAHNEVKINGYSFPKHVIFAPDIYCIHRDPEYFTDPEMFKPERFFPENSLNRHPMAYIPFSAGPRNCIGQRFAMMEGKIVISNILRHFRVHSLDPPDKVIQCAEVVLRPLNGLRIQFEER